MDRATKFNEEILNAMEEIFFTMPDPMILLDKEKKLLHFNAKAGAIFPFLNKIKPKEEIVNTKFKKLFSPAFNLNEKSPQHIEIKDFIYTPKVNRLTKNGNPDGYLLVLNDVTEIASNERKLNHLVTQKTLQLSDIQDRTILGFASLAEGRDGGTGKHLRRTASYVLIIATQMKNMGMYPTVITDTWIENLRKVAPLHDLGKISTPDAILKKPGSLTQEERLIIQEHTVKGYNLIHGKLSDCFDDQQKLQMASEVARSHHEWFDGNGYPDKISGKRIPLSARIMAVADVFDALVTERPYKPGFPFDQAIGMIVKENGTHFDPDVVKAMLECLDTIRIVSENLKDEI